MTLHLLGPQHARPTISRVLRELAVRGPVAVVTAGWQERESDPQSLPELGVAAVNLTLHARADDVFRHDRELEAAYKERQSQLKLVQDFYRIRLDHAGQAARAIGVRHVDPALLADERALSVDVLRRLDHNHVERCRAVRAELDRTMVIGERPRVAHHRRQLAALIEPTDALVIAGGHVAVLLNRLRMFDVIGLAGDRPIIAWSAGAMAVSDRVVLFHDHPPYGEPVTEILEAGLGVAPGVVVLPEPRLRLSLDDSDRVALLAQRFAPAVCVALDHGTRLSFDGGELRSVSAPRLAVDGSVETRWPA